MKLYFGGETMDKNIRRLVEDYFIEIGYFERIKQNAINKATASIKQICEDGDCTKELIKALYEGLDKLVQAPYRDLDN